MKAIVEDEIERLRIKARGLLHSHMIHMRNASFPGKPNFRHRDLLLKADPDFARVDFEFIETMHALARLDRRARIACMATPWIGLPVDLESPEVLDTITDKSGKRVWVGVDLASGPDITAACELTIERGVVSLDVRDDPDSVHPRTVHFPRGGA